MSPTILHMAGYATPTAFSQTTGKTTCVSSMTFDEVVDPPKNIAGKQCVVEAVYCNYETSKPLSTANRANQVAYFGWNLNSIWSHVYASINSPFLQPGLGVRDLEWGRFTSLGPRIVRIPHGPFPIRFLCRTQDLNNQLTEAYSTSDSTNYLVMTVVLHITPVE
jgi:hypothetical protein